MQQINLYPALILNTAIKTSISLLSSDLISPDLPVIIQAIIIHVAQSPEGVFHILTDKDSTSIHLGEVSFGHDKCMITEYIYGTVRNDTLLFPMNTYTDKCGTSYTYAAYGTFMGDTLVFTFNYNEERAAPWHCVVKMVKK